MSIHQTAQPSTPETENIHHLLFPDLSLNQFNHWSSISNLLAGVGQRFASCLWESDDLIELRLLDNRGGVSSFFRADDFRYGWHLLLPTIYQSEKTVYVGINPRRCERSGDRYVKLARSLFADFDNCQPETALSRVTQCKLPPPTVVVNSGNGAHVYWRLEEPINLGQWRDCQKQLSSLLGSDPCVCNPERIMRMPGAGGFLMNRKNPFTPKTTSLLSSDPARKYPLHAISRQFSGSVAASATPHAVPPHTEIPALFNVNNVITYNGICTSQYVGGGPTGWQRKPTTSGSRHRVIFEIIRDLKFNPKHKNRKPIELESEFRRWFLDNIKNNPNVRTKDYNTSWNDFLDGWRRCKKMTRGMNLEQAAAQLNPNDRPAQKLLNLCRLLGDCPSREFFLDCRTSARLCGYGHYKSAYDQLMTLCEKGVIRLVQSGTRGVQGRANRYRWLGQKDEKLVK
ncbi:MAG: hypothetical protein KGL39_38900 [Patescibacteria group bacterium]|nr:hypothetical protein [Patescibacteria group bacterium]